MHTVCACYGCSFVFFFSFIFHQIPKSAEGKEWYWYVDKTVTEDLIKELTKEFLNVLQKFPSKLKRKIQSLEDSSLCVSSGQAMPSMPESLSFNTKRVSPVPSQKRPVPSSTVSSSSGIASRPQETKPHGLPVAGLSYSDSFIISNVSGFFFEQRLVLFMFVLQEEKVVSPQHHLLISNVGKGLCLLFSFCNH